MSTQKESIYFPRKIPRAARIVAETQGRHYRISHGTPVEPGYNGEKKKTVSRRRETPPEGE